MLATFIAQEVRRIGAPVEQLTPIGGLRRYAPAVDRVALLATAPVSAHTEILDALAGLTGRSTALQRFPDRIAVVTDRGPVEVHLASKQTLGPALAWHTGSPLHVSRLRDRSRAHGVLFDNATLQRNGRILECPTEEALYERLALSYVPPELREGADEFGLAERNALPSLVTTRHVRGDLHTHTSWSDGRDTVEQMVRAAHALGYEYLAITDHSERSAASRTLAPGDIARQRAEIDAARLRHPGIQILHGVEVDIMPDGRLDFDDEALAAFDIVLASLHDGAGHDPERLLDRYLRAVENPFVNVITHPANRIPGGNHGYALDFDRLFEAAARTGTAVEVDGSPNHLDLDGALARRATACGAVLTIDSDAHRHDALARQLQFGVGTARRGWVQPEQVLNTRGIEAIRAFVATKRPGGAMRP